MWTSKGTRGSEKLLRKNIAGREWAHMKGEWSWEDRERAESREEGAFPIPPSRPGRLCRNIRRFFFFLLPFSELFIILYRTAHCSICLPRAVWSALSPALCSTLWAILYPHFKLILSSFSIATSWLSVAFRVPLILTLSHFPIVLLSATLLS